MIQDLLEERAREIAAGAPLTALHYHAASHELTGELIRDTNAAIHALSAPQPVPDAVPEEPSEVAPKPKRSGKK